MNQPEEQQLEICLMKYDLEEITNNVIAQHSKIPELEGENEQIREETITHRRLLRSLNADVEKLKEQNDRLTAKRLQLLRQCVELSSGLESAKIERDELVKAKAQEEADIQLIIRKYEDCLEEKADRFKITQKYFKTEKVNEEQELKNSEISELEIDFEEKQNIFNELTKQFEEISAEVPEDILEICGKPELDDKIRLLTEQFKGLSEKLNTD